MSSRLVHSTVGILAILCSCAVGPEEDLANKSTDSKSAVLMQGRIARQSLQLLGMMQGQFELDEGRVGRLDELLRAYPRTLSKETLTDLREYTFREWLTSDRRAWLFMAVPKHDADQGVWLAIGSSIELSYCTEAPTTGSPRKADELVKVDGSIIILSGQWSRVDGRDQR